LPCARDPAVLTARSAAPQDLAAASAGRPWARIGERVGQRNLAVTANTYTHVMLDEGELDYGALLAGNA
jgi:hypothetical protein